jgi:hypothetical protein
MFVFHLCLTRAPIVTGDGLFGFSAFLTALALLALVFTQSDPLYKFRIAAAPLPVGGLTIFAILIIGSASLLDDLWFSLGWYSLPWGVPKAAIQGFLGGLTLLSVCLWLLFAFARPPRFSRFNARRFAETVYRALALGGDNILPAIALEIRRSSQSLIAACKPTAIAINEGSKNSVPNVAGYAYDLLRLIANRKFCRHIVAASPGTAMALMDEAARQKIYSAPLGAFAQNITIEALKNHDSGLYHEDRYGTARFWGQVQPFTRAVYGCYELVEQSATSMSSALDIDYREKGTLSASEWEAYGRALTTTTEDYLKSERYNHHSYVLFRAIGLIVDSTSSLYRINGLTDWTQSREEMDKLHSAMSVIKDIVEQIDKSPNRPTRRHVYTGNRKYWQQDLTDVLCDALVSILVNVAMVSGPDDLAWAVQHNTYWSAIGQFSHRSDTWEVIRARMTRLLIYELRSIRRYADFKSIRIMGLLLNVLGVRTTSTANVDAEFAPLRRYVITLAKTCYIKIVSEQPHVAEAALIGGITFDASKRQLVKTYARGLQVEPARAYLDLDDWPQGNT